MKFIDKINFTETRPRTFFKYSSLAFIFSNVADMANLYLHEKSEHSVLDPAQSKMMQILTSDTVTSTIEAYSLLNINSACIFAIAGLTRLFYKPTPKRPKITNPWRPSV